MTATRAARDLVREHLLALEIGSEVTRWFRQEREPQVLHVTPENVIATLHKAKLRRIAEAVATGEGQRVLQLIADIEAGRTLTI